MNLNELEIKNADGPDVPLSDHSASEGGVSVFFRNLQTHLVSEIKKSHAVVGCVAWMTDIYIIQALSRTPHGAQIVVQKEDFLRQDSKEFNKKNLRALYDAVRCPLGGRYDMSLGRIHDSDAYGSTTYVTEAGDYNGACMGVLSSSGPDGIGEQGVRCVGNANRTKQTRPRMHNKFLVFLEVEEKFDFWRTDSSSGCDVTKSYFPYAVWTGSFNFTHNGTNSLENAVLIESPAIASAYYKEWQQIFAVSEPLDWESEWVEPEFRIGT